MTISRDELVDLLKQNDEMEVTFIKKDGTERKMRCTLKPELLPPKLEEQDEASIKKIKRNTNPDNIPVFDLDSKGWRSFNFESVTYVVLKKDEHTFIWSSTPIVRFQQL